MKKVVFLLLLCCTVFAFGATKEESIEPNFKPYIFNLKQLRITWLDGSIKSGDKVEIRIYDNMNLEENENFKREEFIYKSNYNTHYDISYNFTYNAEFLFKIIINNKKTFLLKGKAYGGKPFEEKIFLPEDINNRVENMTISKSGLFIVTALKGKISIRNNKGNLISEFLGFTKTEYEIEMLFNPNNEEELFIIDNENKKITVINVLSNKIIEEYDILGSKVNKILFSDNTDFFVTIEKKNYEKVFSLWKRKSKNSKFTKTGKDFIVIKCFNDSILYLEGYDLMKCDFNGNSIKQFSIEKYKPNQYFESNGIGDGQYNEIKKTFLVLFGEKLCEIDLNGKILNTFTMRSFFLNEIYYVKFLENGAKFLICHYEQDIDSEAYIFDTEKFDLLNIIEKKYWKGGIVASDNGIILSGNALSGDIKLSVFY